MEEEEEEEAGAAETRDRSACDFLKTSTNVRRIVFFQAKRFSPTEKKSQDQLREEEEEEGEEGSRLLHLNSGHQQKQHPHSAPPHITVSVDVSLMEAPPASSAYSA